MQRESAEGAGMIPLDGPIHSGPDPTGVPKRTVGRADDAPDSSAHGAVGPTRTDRGSTELEYSAARDLPPEIVLSGRPLPESCLGLLIVHAPRMALTRHFTRLLLVLALTITPVITAVHASSMTGELAAHAAMADKMYSDGMSELMPERCTDCDEQVTKAACLQMMCVFVFAIMARDATVLLAPPPAYPAARNESGTGSSRLPDRKPPRTAFLG